MASALATAAVAGIVAIAVVNEGGGGGNASDKPSDSPCPPPRTCRPHRGAARADVQGRAAAPAAAPRLRLGRQARQGPAQHRDALPEQERHHQRPPVQARRHRHQQGLRGRARTPASARCSARTTATASSARPTPASGLAVTVGIAVFDDDKTASAVKKQYKPNLVALKGNGVPGLLPHRHLPYDRQLLRPVRLLHHLRAHQRQAVHRGRQEARSRPGATARRTPTRASCNAARSRQRRLWEPHPSNVPAHKAGPVVRQSRCPDSAAARARRPVDGQRTPVARGRVARRQLLVRRVADLFQGQPVRPYDVHRGVPHLPLPAPRRATPAAGARRRRRASRRPANAPCCGRRRPPSPSPPARRPRCRSQRSRWSVRIVVAPSRFLQ